MGVRRYITAEEFKDFGDNQEQLIQILNHNMSSLSKAMIRMTMDIRWLKKLNAYQIAIISGILVTVICGFMKIAFF